MAERSESITRGWRDSKLNVDLIGRGELSYLEIYIVTMTIELTSKFTRN